MTIVYKLTSKNFTTRNGMLWGDGVEHTAPGNGKMCSKAYIHAYCSPACAAFFAPIHDIDNYSVLWECDADIKRENVDKLGCTRVKTLRQVPLPTLTTEQRIRIAIRCAKLVCSDAAWHAWADKWLSGEDRSAEMARAAWAARMAKDAAWSAQELAARLAAAWSAQEAAAAWATRAAWATQEAVRAVRNASRGGVSMADIHQIIEEATYSTVDRLSTVQEEKK